MDAKIVQKLDKFFNKFPSYEFKKGQTIFQPDTKPKGILYIEEGIVRRYYLSKEGHEITLNLYKPNTFLPMSYALANIPITHFYEALNDTKARMAPVEKVVEFIKKEPDILYDLLRRVYIGMEGLWTHIESLTSGDSYIKLISSLIILAKRFGKQNQEGLVIQLKMNEQDMANYAGMSRETASRELQILKKQNLVLFKNGEMIIQNLEKLENLLLE